MTTAVDTNALVALWDPVHSLNSRAPDALDAAFHVGGLVIAAPVYAELVAAPGRDERFVNRFLEDTGVFVDWQLDEATWRLAARAFRSYAQRRRSQKDSGPRRILTDFLIGAHALRKGYPLLTLDDRLYRAAFPELTIA